MTPLVKDLIIEALTLVCTEHFTLAFQTVLKDKFCQFISRLNDCKETHFFVELPIECTAR